MHASNAPFMSDRASGLRAPRRLVGLVFSLALVMPATATTALAHASDRGFVLLLPTGYYAFAGAAAVTASFLVLAILPSEPVLRLFAARLPLVGIPRRGVAATSLLSFACLAVLVAAGLLGSRDPLSNPLPLVVWTLLWVGLTLAQGTIGDLWRWLNPWSGPLQIAGRVAGRRRTPLSLPRWVGFWPAALFFFGFAWFELIDPAPDDPERSGGGRRLLLDGQLRGDAFGRRALAPAGRVPVGLLRHAGAARGAGAPRPTALPLLARRAARDESGRCRRAASSSSSSRLPPSRSTGCRRPSSGSASTGSIRWSFRAAAR